MKTLRIPLSGTYKVQRIFASESADIPSVFFGRSRIFGAQIIAMVAHEDEHRYTVIYSHISDRCLTLVRAQLMDAFEVCINPEFGHIFAIDIPRPVGDSVTATLSASYTTAEFRQNLQELVRKKKEAMRDMGVVMNPGKPVKPRPRLYLVEKPTDSDEPNGQR